jgi:hypothetical protein
MSEVQSSVTRNEIDGICQHKSMEWKIESDLLLETTIYISSISLCLAVNAALILVNSP